jgi:hypothetical protein
MPKAMMWRSALGENRVRPFSTPGAIVLIFPIDTGSQAISPP